MQLKHIHVDALAYSGFSHKKQTDQITVGFFLPFPYYCSAFQTPALNFYSELLIHVPVTGAVQTA